WTAGHWRAVLPLDRPVTTAEDEFRRVQRACIELAEQGGLDAEKGQSAAHCFALPARGGSAYEFLELCGAFFDVDAALERFPKPEPMPRIERARADGDSYAQRRTRAARYLERMPGAISGSGGHAATFAAACAMVRGFELDPADALELLAAIHNPRCSPPWSVRELRHKVKSAHQRATLPFGYLAERRDGRAA
ncbi:MAG TPA: hypothetical protein VK841_22430, partial [Polyangiaceae bacterium]|nr:hypothetical protein [Polyangiaceae bacterium]